MNWFLRYRRDCIEALKNVGGLSPLECVLLGNRGLREAEEVARYLNPTLDDLLDPFLFRDMDAAVEAIVDCLSSGRSIRIVGDYDQDGVSATAILVRGIRSFAEQLGMDPYLSVSYAIPDRVEDGYGINRSIVDTALREEVGLIITCDNGIAAFDALSYAAEKQLPVIVTDHHQIVEKDGEEVLPEALAVLNPHSAASGYPFPDLCGAGVAYKLIEALAVAAGMDRHTFSGLLQYAALGTICDVVPLVGENRTIVSLGLEAINRTQDIGLLALLQENNWHKEVSVYTVGFVIGPCINASGRLFTARLGVELFLEEDAETAREYAKQLISFNEERKAMTREGVEQAIQQIRAQHMDQQDLILLYLPGIHESICGLIAGRIKEQFYRPTLVFTDAQTSEAGEALLKGSGRSIEAFDLFENLNRHREKYVAFGGHAMACGMSIRKADWETIRQCLQSETSLSEADKTPLLELDCALPISRLNFNVVKTLKRLAPFGSKNPSPLFGAKRCNVRALRLVGANRNVLQLRLEYEGSEVSCVLFDGEAKLEMQRRESPKAVEGLLRGEPAGLQIDIAYRPEENEFRGKRSLQLVLKDIRASKKENMI